MFEEFMQQNVKVAYQDEDQVKIARGVLVDMDEYFVKVKGRLGTIVINKKDLHKMALGKE